MTPEDLAKIIMDGLKEGVKYLDEYGAVTYSGQILFWLNQKGINPTNEELTKALQLLRNQDRIELFRRPILIHR